MRNDEVRLRAIETAFEFFGRVTASPNFTRTSVENVVDNAFDVAEEIYLQVTLGVRGIATPMIQQRRRHRGAGLSHPAYCRCDPICEYLDDERIQLEEGRNDGNG
jgi:hypothetical protein